MTSQALPPGTYTVVEHDEDEDEVVTSRILGTVTLDGEGRLGIVSQEPDEDERLTTIVEECNAEDTMHVDVQPPPGARQFEVFSKLVERGAADFVPALLDHMRTYYDIELQPA